MTPDGSKGSTSQLSITNMNTKRERERERESIWAEMTEKVFKCTDEWRSRPKKGKDVEKQNPIYQFSMFKPVFLL